MEITMQDKLDVMKHRKSSYKRPAHPAIINAVRYALTPKPPVLTDAQKDVMERLEVNGRAFSMAKVIGAASGTLQGLVKRGLIEARDTKGGVKEYRIKRKSRVRYMLNGTTAMALVRFR